MSTPQDLLYSFQQASQRSRMIFIKRAPAEVAHRRRVRRHVRLRSPRVLLNPVGGGRGVDLVLRILHGRTVAGARRGSRVSRRELDDSSVANMSKDVHV